MYVDKNNVIFNKKFLNKITNKITSLGLIGITWDIMGYKLICLEKKSILWIKINYLNNLLYENEINI